MVSKPAASKRLADVHANRQAVVDGPGPGGSCTLPLRDEGDEPPAMPSSGSTCSAAPSAMASRACRSTIELSWSWAIVLPPARRGEQAGGSVPPHPGDQAGRAARRTLARATPRGRPPTAGTSLAPDSASARAAPSPGVLVRAARGWLWGHAGGRSASLVAGYATGKLFAPAFRRLAQRPERPLPVAYARNGEPLPTPGVARAVHTTRRRTSTSSYVAGACG